jgi:hypothetical protein
MLCFLGQPTPVACHHGNQTEQADHAQPNHCQAPATASFLLFHPSHPRNQTPASFGIAKANQLFEKSYLILRHAHGLADCIQPGRDLQTQRKMVQAAGQIKPLCNQRSSLNEWMED